MFAIVWLTINLQFFSASSITHQFVQWSNDHKKNVEYENTRIGNLNVYIKCSISIQFTSLYGVSGLSRIFLDV